ncbi:histamine H2 receptor [Wyeomyia smithii]|uniref:histamine H2 receptor n=1 Tax=Wyeomyia smithii TaxID=174621 RepID=UPI002467C01E|nr:histamine H2 receptor [Wyeomyia smithii]
MLDSSMEAMEADPIDTTTIRVFADRVTVINDHLFIWAIIDGVLMVCILSGNILTILAVRYHRRLRQLLSNLFVLSLAMSDIFVGLTLPYHLAFYMGNELGHYKYLCLLRFFVLIIACGVSIWNLIAIAVDRYIAICYPLHYTRVMTKKVALVILAFGWFLAVLIASIPLIWNKWNTAMECEFDELLHPWYVAGVITPLFSLVWICLLIVYWRIWREAVKHTKQLRVHNSQETSSDWKSVQVVLLIIGCFTFCWLPYFVVILTQIFHFFEYNSPVLYKAVFSLAMANSMMNPLIYAWKNSSFRHAFSKLLTCKRPDQCEAVLTDSPAGKTSKVGSSRTNMDDLRYRTSTSRISQTSIESATHSNGPEITYVSTIHDESSRNHTIQVALGTTNEINGSSVIKFPSMTTHIIQGNVIINNYNLYDSFLDVKNQNHTNRRDSSGNKTHNRDCKQQKTGDSYGTDTDYSICCDKDMCINNVGMQENITKL